MGTLNELLQGREACRRHAWGDAYEALASADRAMPLAPGDLDLLATAAYLTGRNAEFHTCLDRAHRAYLEGGERTLAAGRAFWLGLDLFLRGEAGQANGWFARAQRLIEGQDCVEQGYLLLPLAEQQLSESNAEAAHASATRAARIGERFADADLVSCARHLQGRALILQRRVGAGLVLLDEAMIAVVAGDLSPIMTGLIYCSVIDACRQIYALGRAREWTAALATWCETQAQMVAFTGACLVHRAEIMQLRGAWPEAMAEACRACERFSQEAGTTAPAPALYRRAELHRLRGEFTAADEAYRNASRSGWEPQPGLALLRLAQGRADAASVAIHRVLGAATDPLRRARLLPAYVEIMLVTDQFEAARNACLELEQIAAEFDIDVLGAMAAQSRGAVDLADGDAQAALAFLHRAFEAWQAVGAPYEAARARVLKGLACRLVGDDEAGDLELDGARSVFERLGAAPDLARLDAGGKHATPLDCPPLTRRERQVLRLIIAGKTNKAIAAEFSLSERTIDRHVSNILTKLDVPSRAAATAYAYAHNLV